MQCLEVSGAVRPIYASFRRQTVNTASGIVLSASDRPACTPDGQLQRVLYQMGTAVAQWLRCCGTNRKVAGSIPAGVSGFFIDIKSFRSHFGPGIDSASNRNEYQEHFLGVKAAGA